MYHIAICDDDAIFIEYESKCIGEYMSAQNRQYQIDTYLSGEDLLRDAEKLQTYDIIFLDMEMKEQIGIEVAFSIRQICTEVYIIFVTAYVAYMREGYYVNAWRYILKDGGELKFGIEESLRSIIRNEQKKDFSHIFDFVEESRKLDVRNIIYIESNLHYLTFHVDEGEEVLYKMYGRLDVVEQGLPGEYFCRTHKSYLVNAKYIRRIQRYYVEMAEGICKHQRLNVSQSQYNAAKKKIALYKGKFD